MCFGFYYFFSLPRVVLSWAFIQELTLFLWRGEGCNTFCYKLSSYAFNHASHINWIVHKVQVFASAYVDISEVHLVCQHAFSLKCICFPHPSHCRIKKQAKKKTFLLTRKYPQCHHEAQLAVASFLISSHFRAS